MSEAEIKAEIQLELSKNPNIRLFNNVVGQFWHGKVIGAGLQTVTLKHPRRLRSGVVGASDLIGWHSIVVTPEMVGKRVAVFSACEVKSQKGKASEEQLRFIDAVDNAGGIAGVARSVLGAKDIYSAWLERVGILSWQQGAKCPTEI